MRLTSHFFPARGAAVACVILALTQQVSGDSNGTDTSQLDQFIAANPVATTYDAPQVASNVTIDPALLKVALDHCPVNCNEFGFHPNNWTLYSRPSRLVRCNQPMLLDFSLFTSLRQAAPIRACTVDLTSGTNNTVDELSTEAASCTPLSGNMSRVEAQVELTSSGPATPVAIDDLQAATNSLSTSLSASQGSCNQSLSLFAYSNLTSIGLFAGSGVSTLVQPILQQFVTGLLTEGFPDSAAAQMCADAQRSSRYSFGIFAVKNGDLAAVQEAVALWSLGGCVSSYDRLIPWQNMTLSVPVGDTDNVTNTSNNTISDQTQTAGNSYNSSLVARHAWHLNKRSDCSTIQVASGDTCSSLANECGISGNDFMNYNPQPNLCSTLQPGQHVCCTSGTLPNYAPQPNSDGSCSAYNVVAGDTCSQIAASHSITIANIENWNSQTWGWQGCALLQASQTICLSTGSPPLPAPIPNAVCGPQKPGTSNPGSGVDISTLNPCPLNACCDKYGQCGTTAEFCTISQSATGAPGTSAPGQNGCISNCGTNIVLSSYRSEFLNIGYFEGYNDQRPCLNQDIRAFDLGAYTHVHMAFATLSTSFAIDISSIQSQFTKFVQMTGFKKIISIGGWTFSTDPSTYTIFRQAVQPGNQATTINNIVSFVNQYNLDGVDFDWEYPDAPDIPGIPAGAPQDSDNYLSFLQQLRSALPTGKSISFAAPASYWYLRGYHIAEMAKVSDYIIYMTYDLHGQWDYSNPWATDGCPAGNCLRSHVNLTETVNSLSMITKAGVPSNKIVVGVTSYGRSFQMTTPGCTGPMCTYTGHLSGATPGLCTGTPSYLAEAEILSILAGTGQVLDPSGALDPITSYTSYLDVDSVSNIAVYNDVQWVSYMDFAQKFLRAAFYQSLTMGGTTDWAIDLRGSIGTTVSAGASGDIVYPPPSIWSSANPTVGCDSPPCILVLPPYPLNSAYTVTNWPALTTTLLSSASNGVQVVTTTIPVPSFTISNVNFHPVTLRSQDNGVYTINPVQSITPTAFVYTLPPFYATFPVTSPTSSSSSSSSTLPPVVFFPTPVAVTLQPQPTFSVSYPPPSTPVPAVTVSPTPTPPKNCEGDGCGVRDCEPFGCDPGCGEWSCGGGCSIFGCGGRCGIDGCIPGCPLYICGGLGCIKPGGCGNTQGSNGEDSSDECQQSITASACTYVVTSFQPWPLTTPTRTTETTCITSTACNGGDTFTTTTPGSPQCTIDPAIYSAISVYEFGFMTTVDGGAYPSGLLPDLDPGYVPRHPELTAFGFDSSTTINVQVPTSVATTATSTTAITLPTGVSASCTWDVDFDSYEFEIDNISGWATDGGLTFYNEMAGCGYLGEWIYHPASGQTLPYVTFGVSGVGAFGALQAPRPVPSGCIESAIVLAGGPAIQCQEDFSGDEAGAGGGAKVDKRQASSTGSGVVSSTTRSTSKVDYTPMTWPAGKTVTLTSSLVSYSTSLMLSALTFNGTTFASQTTGTSTPSATSTGSTSTPTGLQVQPTVGPFVAYGCYSDDAFARALSRSYRTPNMTLELCAAQADSAAAHWFGVEFGAECYFDSAVGNNHGPIPQSLCDMPCPGNSSQLCGASDAIQLYGFPSVQSNVTIPASVGQYTALGCYSDSGFARALPNRYPVETGMTLEICAQQAAAAGAQYFGVEYGVECYYASSIQNNQGPISQLSCGMTCPGNPAQWCGGSNAIQMYSATGTVQPAVQVPNIGQFTPLGCYSDNGNARALPNRYANEAGMTLEMCAQQAVQAGAQYFGVEYGAECYYASSIQNGQASISQSSCSMTCLGNPTQLCGGSNAIQIYTAATAVQSVVVVPSIGDYDSIGCYSDNGNARALANEYANENGMTLEMCAQQAAAAGAQYFGVEYGAECYFGTSIQNNQASIAQSSCSKTCLGNPTQWCGGSNAIQMYTAATAVQSAVLVPNIGDYSSIGCYSDSGNARALSNQWGGNENSMTLEFCAQQAAAAGAQYFGVEYGAECYWGSAIQNNQGSIAQSSCSKTCLGNPTQWCGGSNAIQVYLAKTVVQSTVAVPGMNGYNYNSIGCYSDNGNARALPTRFANENGMTLEMCAQQAAAAGAPYFGVEYGAECYYASSIQNGQGPISQSSCNKNCLGNPNQWCGGSNAIQVYIANTVVQPTVRVYNAVGCYSDNGNARALSNRYANETAMTLEICAQQAIDVNAQFFGVEYSGECYFGTSIQNGQSPIAQSSCDMTCLGNPWQWCGGSNAIQLYEHNWS